ncbi:redox-regulated ATPase YchF [Candidatus Gracilibacteria bacterium]|nr:redox-regulated ATPase YchF [Candidatus Gracilibacteria bacterium]
MKIGIVGLPNVGKSTLFNALTKSYSAPAENFPFCTIDPNVGIVQVKDTRVDKLAEISQSKKKVYAHIEFVDIAGLVKGASKGEGLGNKFLSHIREVDAIVQVLRYFQDTDVVHVEGTIDPLRDVEIINTELIMADLEQIDRHLPAIAKRGQVAGNKDDHKLAEILGKIQQVLQQGKIAHSLKEYLSDEELKLIKPYNFLTMKPFIYAINVSQEDLASAHHIADDFMIKLQSPVSIVSAKLESEMMDMSNDEKQEFITELLSIDKVTHIPTLDDLISITFNKVGLMYYFTTGEKETKAWTIPLNSTAPQAAGAIHTDFERGFIKADVVKYSDLLSVGSRSKARDGGLLKMQGKDYIVQDGDVMIFKFNV